MKIKWIEYSTEFPYFYGIACLLDPGVRKEGLKNMLEHYYELLEVSYNWNLYVNITLQYDLINLYAPATTQTVAPSKTSNVSRFNNTMQNILSKKQKAKIFTSAPSDTTSFIMHREFFSYNYELDDDFSILT